MPPPFPSSCAEAALLTVSQQKLQSLDDTDPFATSWQYALEELGGSWGGRGRGGRGIARRSVQPATIRVDQVRLAYVAVDRVLLSSAVLQLNPGRVYALTGRNGSGKSTLLQRIDGGRIPGFPPHISTLYLPQEVSIGLQAKGDAEDWTPLQLLQHFSNRSTQEIEERVQALEDEMEQLIQCETDDEDYQEKMEQLADDVAAVQEEMIEESDFLFQAGEALKFSGVREEKLWNQPLSTISTGLCKKVQLAIPFLLRHSTQLLLLDEPTNGLDFDGLLMARELIDMCAHELNMTVVLVSHDRDFLDDVSDHVMAIEKNDIIYRTGNYATYEQYQHESVKSKLKAIKAREQKKTQMVKTLKHLQQAPIPKRGGGSKKAQMIQVQRRKMDREFGKQNDEPELERRGLSMTQFTERTEQAQALPPDRAVQFVLHPCTSTWSEPLIVAQEVGHGFNCSRVDVDLAALEPGVVTKKKGYLFDNVDLLVEEGMIQCIMGSCGSGKSTLLQILAGKIASLEGKVDFATGVEIGFLDMQHARPSLDSINDEQNALSYLMKKFPSLSEDSIRGELSAFGLSPQQATQTSIRYLSGGEHCRLAFTSCMLRRPHVLILDEPTAHLDIESVSALVHGLTKWNGTVVLVSHDTNFLRSLPQERLRCCVLMASEGKVRRVVGGVDEYLRTILTSDVR